MKYNYPYKNIVHAIAENKQELNRAFIRIQEFYESPYPDIRGKKFTLEQYIPLYSADNGGKFTYYNDWIGNNIPGNIIKKFFSLYKNSELSEQELEIKKFLSKKGFLKPGSKFYLIACAKNTKPSFGHELSHALYYLNKGYRKRCQDIIKKIDKNFYNSMFTWLSTAGYTKEVIPDEIQAYLSEGDMIYIVNRSGYDYNKIPWNLVYELRKNFLDTSKKLKKPA